MATGTVPPNAASTGEAPHPFADQIEEHVRRTQGYLRGCDIASALITIAVFLLGYLMAFAVVDHWLWPGGLGRAGRMGACLIMVVVVALYTWRALWPHLFRRINPVYAADRLEHAQPSLMNSLVNLLMLREDKRPVPDAVMRGLERQAATGIAHLPADAAVDRTRLLRTAYVLVGMLLLAGAYVLFSPKSPFVSVARVLAPWADIAPVTRVRIAKVAPGTADVYRGDPVTVTAEIRGLRDDEPVTLRYASLDGQTENQSVSMFRREGQTAHSCVLPPDTAGMQRDLVYRIEAGDAPKKEYRLTVVPAPTIQIEEIEYRYPAYTRMKPLTVERLGDIKAIEGTQVVIRAKASEPIASASLELAGPKDLSMPMQTRGELAARAELPLKMVKVDGQFEPEYTSYKLGVTNARGDRNREPAAYRIEVTHDLPPHVDVFDPKMRDIELPVDKELNIEVRARDADFALGDVRLLLTRKTERLADESLVAGQNMRLDQPVRGMWKFSPARYNLKPGDEVQFRAVAIDNKTPQPNRQQTPEYQIQIVAPEVRPTPPRDEMQRDDMQRGGKADQQRDAGGKSATGEQGNAGQPQENKNPAEKQPERDNQAQPSADKRDGAGTKQDGKQQEGKQQEGSGATDKSDAKQQGSEGAGGSQAQGSDSPQAGNDPKDDTDAVQEIVNYLENQAKAENQKQQSGKQQKEQTQTASADNQRGNSGQNRQPENKQSQENQQGSKQDNKQQENKQSQGDQQGSQKQDGNQQQSGKQDGNKQDGKQQDGKQGAQQQSGKNQGGQPDSAGGKQGAEQGSEGAGSQGNPSGTDGGQKSTKDQQSPSPGNSPGQKSGSSDGKQQSAQQKSNPSGGEQGTKPDGGMGQSGVGQKDGKQSGDQTAQKQPGETQAGSSSAQDKSASAERQPGNKDLAQGKPTDNQSGSKPTGNEPKSNQPNTGEGNSDIVKKASQLADKIGKAMNKKDGKQPDSSQQPDGKQQDQVAARDPGQKQPGDKQPNANPSGGNQTGEGQQSQQEQEKPDSGQRGTKPQPRDPQSQPEKQPGAADGGKPQSGGSQGKQQEDGNSSDGKRPEDNAKDIANKSGESSNNSESGSAKDKAQDKAHTPNNTPGKKEGMPSDSESSEHDTNNKPNQRPTDTGSSQGGERSGKGQKGQGQASSGAGGGSAGKNQAADDGGSKSEQSGPGDKSNRAGKQQQSDQPTGQASKQAGDAQSGDPENKQQKDGQAQQQADGSQPGDPNPNAQQGMQPGEGKQVEGQASGAPTGTGGRPGGGESGPSADTPGGEYVPGSDQANLDYAKRATDLTLTYLQDQLAKGKVDDGLRKRLGWSEEEFQSLLKRMQTMRDKGADPKARPEDKLAYEQWLKSLGLRPGTGPLRTGKPEKKALEGAVDDVRVSVPRDLREQHEAFRQSLLEKSQ